MRLINKKRLFDGHFKIDELTLTTKSGEIIYRECLQAYEAVGGIVYDTVKDEYIFVKQFRPGVQDYTIEVVAGIMDDGLTPEQTMIREIMEEAGYAVDKIIYIGDILTSPGHSSEIIHLFYAEVSNQITAGGGLETEHEEIEIISIPKEKIHTLNITDAKTLVSLYKIHII